MKNQQSAASPAAGNDETPSPKLPKPPWIRVRLPSGKAYTYIKNLIHKKSLHTVCESAMCPNIAECWNRSTATFMILGNVCTRSCRFCAVKSGTPWNHDPDTAEAVHVAQAVKSMNLRHAVVTSVTRDDLPDGGAARFADTVDQIHAHAGNCTVEVLIPDFQGCHSALKTVTASRPQILGHNLETVPRLYERVRPQARYRRSIDVLEKSKSMNPNVLTKSGIMLGLGERWEEVLEVMDDLNRVGCDIFTMGQYLQPTKAHLPVLKYYTPDEFETLKNMGLRAGFSWVESGPLVRSSYHADEQAERIREFVAFR